MKRKLSKIFILLLAIPLLLIWLCNSVITNAAEGKTFFKTKEIPKNKVGLVLGTSKKLIGGLPNPYYTFRIRAAVELFQADKVDFILVSGDNGTTYYNEPQTFKNDLVKGGIPRDIIFLDYAGFRTLDSMVRAKEVFGLDSVTVISQQFHNERAIYLGEKKGLVAIGYNAEDISMQYGLKVQLREYLARVKVFIDLLFNTKPKFYGERVEIKCG
ncbi:SanA protein [Pricia antarctica]|uniref:SanA protein n=1 Tax=Pricia antarctica TaxID=641691 RepID=A0A1G7ADT6_9FLAO|nr:ElyC/SanA/YdcF family protein [Pricia antarctica]SDE12972.1 SanA protein [Pricia antarctica]